MDNGSPMICSVVDAVRNACSEISLSTSSHISCKPILVTQYEEAASLAEGMTIVMNRHPEWGISHSMQLGIEAAGAADAYMFCVCDQPGIRSSTIMKLIDAYASCDAGIVSLAWKGRMSNPKIFSAKYRDELMSLSGDIGGRQIISAHIEDLLLVEADSIEEVLDIDSPE